MAETEKTSDVTALTVELLKAYLANNTIPSDGLSDLIRTTRMALTEDTKVEVVTDEPTFTPAVSIRKSLSSSAHILSLIDGKPYKTLKRHLSANGLTPDTYRARYNLPASYPMVAADFAAKRREIAQRTGLGNRSNAPAVESAQVPAEAAKGTVVAEDAPAKASKAKPSAAKPSATKAAATKSSAPKPKTAAKPEASKAAADVVPAGAVAVEAPGKVKVAQSKAAPKVKPAAETETKAAPAKPAAPRTKAKAGGSKPAAKPGASLALTAGLKGDGATAETPKASSAKPASKPRGKLGLFGKSAPEPDAG